MKRFLQYFAATIILFTPIYYFRFSVLGLPTNLVELAILALAVLVIIWSVKYEEKLSLPSGWFWPALLIILGMTLGCLIAPDKRVAFGILKAWIILPTIFSVCVYQIFRKTDLPLLINSLWASIMFVSFYGILQYFGWIHLLSYQNSDPNIQAYLVQKRALAFFESPNYLAMYLVPATLLLLSYFQGRKDYFSLVSLIIPGLAVGLTDSRGGLAALVIGLTFITLYKRSWRIAVTGMVASLVIIVGALVYIPHLGGSGGDQARIYIWQQSADLIKAHPVLGIGPGQFQDYLNQKLAGDSYYITDVKDFALHPHNVFLAYWLYGGLLSLIGFIWLLATSLKIKGKAPLLIGLAAALIGILVQGLFDTTYFKNDLSLHFWLIIVLIAIMVRKENNE